MLGLCIGINSLGLHCQMCFHRPEVGVEKGEEEEEEDESSDEDAANPLIR